MAIGRFFSHLKRKLRIILICVAAVTFTVTLAFYNAEEVSVREIPLRPKILPKIVDHGAMPDENKVETEKYVQVAKEEVKPKEPAITDAVKQSEEQNDKDQKQYSHEQFNTNVSEIATVPKQQQASYSSVTYPPLKEFVGEFDTADIYKHVIAQQGGPFGATNISRSSSSGKLRVFILPFTHVDPGWLRTFDSYSEDTNKILDNMHSFLTKNPAMRFMWAEFVFFERWWKLKNETIKQDVRKMIEEGRLELASGSWVMTDEANAYFPVSVDNIVEGHQFLQKELGMKASTIWSNDPFGYSNSVPYLFRQTGIKRNVINRIHHGIKGYLQGHKGIPFQWRQYFENSDSDDVLTHVLPYTHYDILNSCGPNAAHCCEFDFKRMTHWSCPGPKPVAITPANVAEKAGRLVSELKTMAQLYEAPVLLQMHGDDFRFDMIEEWHQHHDNFLPLFTEINKGNEVEISFGTFNDYFTELEKFYEKEKKQPAILTGDFFPYKCALGDLWTGYYTTRPFYKRQGRLLHNLIRSADIASAFNPSNSENVKALEGARRTLSLFQHHDAITGTSKIHVMKDYSSLLFQAQTKANAVLQSALKQSLKTEISVTHSATLFNETQTKHQIILDSAAAYVSIYNPLPYVLSDTVSVRVNSTRLSVSSGGKTVPAQIEPYIYKGDVAQDSYLLTFSVKLSPLGVTVVELKEGDEANVVEINALAADTEKIQKVLPKPFKVTEIAAEQLQLATSRLSTSHDPNTGLLTAIKSSSSGTHKARMSLIAYRNSMGGAYLMRVRSEAQSYIPSSVPKMLVKGPVQQSIHSFMGNVYQRITAKQVDGVLGDQLDVHVRINILKETNTEVAMRLETDFEAPQVFADSVGMQLLKRESHAKLDTAANYYPMPSAAVVEDGKTRLTIGSNVEHGMKEIPRGVEIMIDRILNQDDGKGLGSTADAIPTDMLPVDMQFSVLFEKKTQKDETAHYSAHTPSGHLSVQNVLYPPVVAVSSEKPSPLSTDSLPALPCDYQLLTVRPIQDNKKMLILFRHGTAAGAETNESCGTDVTAAVKSLLSAIKVTKVQETNLSGTENVGSEKTVSEVVVNIEPFKFLALIAS